METNPLLENEPQQRTMEKLTDIELTSIDVTEAKPKSLTKDANSIVIQVLTELLLPNYERGDETEDNINGDSTVATTSCSDNLDSMPIIDEMVISTPVSPPLSPKMMTNEGQADMCTSTEAAETFNIACQTGYNLIENDIETPYGNLHVAIQGNKSKMAILTFHDIGLNHVSCFQGFFSYEDMQPILRHFCVYHVNAPGQEEGAMHLRPQHDALGNPESLGNRFVYPTMDQLAESVQCVVDHYGIKRFIGFGVGAGANILSRYALNHEHEVDSLVLINPTSTQASWAEWGNQKLTETPEEERLVTVLSSFYLWRGQMTTFSEEHLLWHWFGAKTRWENNDLIAVFREYVKAINPQNLSLLIESYIKRTDLGIVRELDPMKKSNVRSIKCRTMILVGDDAPHLEDAVAMNSRMDPSETDFFKIQDCGGMPLEETPDKVCEAFRLFLQGMGYVPSLRQFHKPSRRTELNTRHQPDFTNTTPVC